MSVPIPLSAGDATALIFTTAKRTRAASRDELYQALNYGVGKAVRAISSVKPQLFASFVDPFVLGAGQAEYDVSTLYPEMLKPHHLLVDGGGGKTTPIGFTYKAITSPEFVDAQVSRATLQNSLYYDILDGLLPGAATALAADVVAGSQALTVVDPTLYTSGSVLTMPVGGIPQTPAGWTVAAPTSYLGYVASISGSTLTVQPPLGDAAPATTPVTPLRRKVLVIAPVLQANFSGRLWYTYTPPRLQNDNELLPPGLTRHIDMVIAYAMEWLKKGADDGMEARWAMAASEMRAELVQDADPLANENSESFGSALEGIVDW